MTNAALQLPRPPTGLTDTPSSLADVCDHLATAGRFGFDTEFIGELSYHPRLCLVQVATDERVELIDPLALEDLGPLWDLMTDPAVEKICHAGEQDLAIIWHESGRQPRRVFDCQIAAGLVGIGYQEPYARLVEIVAGVALPKGDRYSAWDQRPLSDSQFKYAVDDVRYLPEIHRMLRGRLESLERTAWMTEACDDLCLKAVTEQDPATGMFRVKGISRLKPRQLSVLRELWMLRDQLARAGNLPVPRVFKDDILVDLATQAPETMKALSAARVLPPEKIASYGDRVVAAVKRGRALPPDQWPCQPPTLSRETRRLVDIMLPASQLICLGQSVSPTLVANREQIERLARLVSEGDDLAEHELMRGWIGECLGGPLLDLIRGQSSVRLRVTPERMHAEFEPNA